MGLLDDGDLQCDQPTAVLVQEVENHAMDHRSDLHLCEYRDVVRKIRDRGDEFVERLLAQRMVVFHPDLG